MWIMCSMHCAICVYIISAFFLDRFVKGVTLSGRESRGERVRGYFRLELSRFDSCLSAKQCVPRHIHAERNKNAIVNEGNCR